MADIPHREENNDLFCGIFPHLLNSPTISLTGERAQTTFRGRPRGRLGRVGSGNGCVRGRPRGRLGIAGPLSAFVRARFGSTQGTGAILEVKTS